MFHTRPLEPVLQRQRPLWRLAALALCISACSQKAKVPAPQPIDESRAKALIAQMSTTLLGELQAAVKAGGPESAIRVCADRAPAIAKELSQDEYAIRRIGVRVRNQKSNAPTALERTQMEALSQTSPSFQGTIDGKPVYMQAIFLGAPLCLTCHGPATELAQGVTNALAELYPDDQATGFALGDLRGAFIVERR